MHRATVRSTPNGSRPKVRLDPPLTTAEPGHTVQFYEDDTFLVGTVAEFLAAGLAGGQSVIVIATPDHRRDFARRLQARGFDVDRAAAEGRLTMLDAREMLGTFMVDSMPDAERFVTRIGSAIAKCSSVGERPCVRAYGEMVDLLWKDGNVVAAVRLEQLWNELADLHAFLLLCAYSMSNFDRADHHESFALICGEHEQVIPTERYTQADECARLLEVSMLQQRARALESEVDFRKNLERELREVLEARRMAEETLRRSEQELKDFLENAAEGMHWVGPDGIVIWANKAELDLLGYSREEYVGQHISRFHADRGKIDAILTHLHRNEELRECEARLLCKDGSTKDVLINSNVLRRDGKFVHTRCFTRDITELKRAMAERESLLAREQSARRDAEEASRAKSQFLAVMSHELRTPLNAIGGHIQLIEMELHGPVTPEQREALGRVERSQRHLLALISNVLNLASIESGHVEYTFCEVATAPLLAEIASMLDPIFAASELTCTVVHPADVSSDEPMIVHADREKTRQILLNLVTNAIKFTPAGGSITLETVRNEPDLVSLRVRDSGIGIPEGKLESIFEPFVQLEARPANTGHQGVGLGLAISRDLARGMGGDLVAESRPGEGSTFTLTLKSGR
jgi:PAS domain S-box-containing protein